MKLPLYKFKEYLKNNSYITKLILLNSLIALLVLVWSFQFDVDILIKNLAIVVFVFFMLLVINIWSIVSQRNVINQQKRVEVMEQYIPVIDDLMSEVRARQHEFNNKLLAIYSILAVSYTHLDVYKRQGQGEVYLAENAYHVDVVHLEPGDSINVESENLLAFTEELTYSTTFVGSGVISQRGLFSTHLKNKDVYKRQI